MASRKRSNRRSETKRRRNTKPNPTAGPGKGTARRAKITLERPETNARESLTAVPEFGPGTPESLVIRTPIGQPGTYLITYVLSIPGQDVYRSTLDITKIMESGNSLLGVPPGWQGYNFYLTTDFGVIPIGFRANKNSFLSQAQIRVSGQSLLDAERLGHDLVYPLLSLLSFHHDASLDVAGYEVCEEATEVRKYVFGLAGKVKSMDLTTIPRTSKPEFRIVFSAYRDGLNATNPFYQVLSFYRVIEGVRGLRRKRKERAEGVKEQWRAPIERMPSNVDDLPPNSPWVLDLFKPYLGKKFTSVLDEFRGLFRNALAHLNPEQDVLLTDRFDDISSCEKVVPVLKYIARQMLLEELRYDPDYSMESPTSN